MMWSKDGRFEDSEFATRLYYESQVEETRCGLCGQRFPNSHIVMIIATNLMSVSDSQQ
jgi:hypothetical protein